MVLEPISAAVLAGGQSSRMGTDKALLPLIPGGGPLLEIVLERLRLVSNELLIVAPERPGYDAFGARVVPDLFAGGGALVGIHSALSHAAHAHCSRPYAPALPSPSLRAIPAQHLQRH